VKKWIVPEEYIDGKGAWKIEKFKIHPFNVVLMPKGAEVFSVADGEDYIAMYAIVDPDAKLEQRRFIVITEEGPMPRVSVKHIGSAKMTLLGDFLFHVFERI
jgi:hypothetical protein